LALLALFSKTRDAQRYRHDFAGEALEGEAKEGLFTPLWRRVSVVTLLLCLTLSALTYHYAVKYVDLNTTLDFRKMSTAAQEEIKLKVIEYSQVLTATTAHMGSHYEEAADDHGHQNGDDHEGESESFEHFVAGLGLSQNFPGILGVGLVGYRPHNDAPTPQERLLNGLAHRNVGPVNRPATASMTIVDIAPLHRNQHMLGLNLGRDQYCRAALSAAHADRTTKLTNRLLLKNGEERLPGFFLVRAIYAPTVVSQTGEVISDHFLGWGAVPFSAESVTADLGQQLGRDYELTIFDGAFDEGFDSGLSNNANKVLQHEAENADSGRFEHVSQLEMFGQTWTLRFNSTSAFDAAHDSYLPTALLLIGLFVSFLIWLALRANMLRSSLLSSVAALRERQLGARRDENRTLLETNVLAIMTLDEQSHITFANSTALDLFGVTEEAMIFSSFDKFVSLHSEVGHGDIANAVGNGSDDDPLLLDVQTSTWRTEDDKVQTTALIRNVTEQVASLLELEVVQKRYDIALAGAGIGVFDVDLSNGMATVSVTSRQIMGASLDKEEFDQDRDFFSRVHPDDLPLIHESDRRCIVGEAETSEVEYRLRFPDGWRWMKTEAVGARRGADGRATRLIGTQRDITDIRRARNALELSEARFRMMMDAAPVGTAILDEKGRFIKVNPALATLTGYDIDSFGPQMVLSKFLSRADHVTMSRDIRRLLNEGEVKTYQNQFQFETRSGELRWGLFNFSWTYDKNRGEYIYVTQVVDITDQKRIDKAKGEFVSTVSHELRTPLTSIKGALGLLEASAAKNLSGGANRLLEIAQVNADRLTVMVNDILDLEKLKSGEITFQCEDVPLFSVVEEAVKTMVPFAVEHQNTIDFSHVDRSVEVKIDVARLRQVLTNLLSNACKFSDPETAILVRYSVRDDDVIISIQNTGPPVPESYQSTMFDAFTQCDASDTRSKGGTGLGLHIVRQIVERLGGEIGFELEKDRRTTFWFTCPRAVDVDNEDIADPPLKYWREEEALNILHVEDDRDFADVIAAGFGSSAHVMRAGNLAKARQLVNTGKFDIVLLDWVLPDGHASALLEDIENHLPKAVVIALSASNDVIDDPRVAFGLTKSQVDIDTIVEQALSATEVEPKKQKKAVN